MDIASDNRTIPIYVDLDGTLVQTDVAQELLVQVAAKPRLLPGLLAATRRGRASVKHYISEQVRFDPATLPYDAEVLSYLRQEKDKGRRIVLASATDVGIAEAIADHLQIFDAVMASTPDNNLKGEAKRAALEAASPEGFEYIGDSNADRPVWKAASHCGFVNPPAAPETLMGPSALMTLHVEHRSAAPLDILKAMRPHQWAKNVLVFLPLFFSHGYGDPARLLQALLAFVAFSICASAIYIVNDLLDIEADRHHPRKQHRPFASGRLRPLQGVILSALLLIAGLGLSLAASGGTLLALLLIYILSTTLYSAWLKHKAIIDVVVLTCLYTLRIYVGGVAVSAPISVWLLNFSLFFFVSLALMKRYTEMRHVENAGGLGARAYRVSDMQSLLPMGIASGGLAVLTLTLYLNSAYVAETYAAPQLLWLVAPLTMFWIFRAWLLAQRDEIDDDPVVFALRDHISRLSLVLAALLVLTAKFLPIGALPQ